MKKFSFIFMLIAIVPVLSCSKPNQEELNKLTTQIEQLQSQLVETKKEAKKYGEGSALQSMVSLRLSVQEQTLAMLEQKKAASGYFPKSSYTINGKGYLPKANAKEIVQKLQDELQTARDEWKISQGKAENAGGLLAALALMEAEMKGLTVAQLEYQLSAEKNGYPALYPKIDTSKLNSPMSQVAEDVEQQVNPPKPSNVINQPTKEEIELEKMRNYIDVKLLNKTYYPSDYKSNRYDDTLHLEFQYKNKSEKDIRAFTGYVSFMDVFDRVFLNVNLTVDNGIKSKQQINDSDKSLKINKFNDKHEKLIATEMANLKMEFTPQSILFTDGSKLGKASR